jgi:hypothetical protein
VSDITGYSLFAKARVGDNSLGSSGQPELLLGTDSDCVAFHTCWDPYPDDFDSGPRFAKLTAEGDADTATWSLGGSQPCSQTYNSATLGDVGKVQLRAGITVPGMVKWSSVTIQWYRDGVMVDYYSRRTGPTVDERGAEGPVEAEQVLSASTTVRDADKVVVWGDVEIACDAGVYPGPDALFAEVFVFPAL